MKSLPDLNKLSVAELADLVKYHNQRYWDQNDPEISDYDYDKLVEKLKSVAPDHAVLSHMGPTESTFGAEVKHKHPMLSLDKCYSDADLDKWSQSFTGDAVAMPKFDGIACSLHYNDKGQLTLAATRGDGVTGDDITVNAREIKDIPRKIKGSHAVEVRGEIFMKLSVFAKFKAEGMANPRNLAAGAIKQKDPKKSAAYGLSFAAYDLHGTPHKTLKEALDYLGEVGFHPIDHMVVGRAELADAYKKMAQKRASLDYEIDGVVFKANSLAEQQRLGSTAHHPRFALAYKFQGDSGTSTLRAVEWSVARTGAITPVAIVDPVQLSGVTVTRASLHHPGFIKKLGLSIGAEVVMMRRGGVIPNVEFVSKAGEDPVEIPTKCPSCGSATRWEKDFLLCTKPATCRAVVIGMLAHYATATDMLGFGDAILEQAYDAGLLRSPADFYTLKADALAKLDRCGEKIATKLVKEVDKKRTLDLPTFLRALGLPELGKNVSKILNEKYKTLEAARKVTAEEFAQVHGIGDVIARTVVEGLKDASDLIDALLKHVKIEEGAAAGGAGAAGAGAAKSGAFAGMTFVFTGKMGTLERKPAEDLVATLGGTALDAVNKALTYLVVGDLKKPGEKSSKEKAAEKHIAAGAALKVISETDFLKMVEEAKKAVPAAEPPAKAAPVEEAAPAAPAQPEAAKPAKPDGEPVKHAAKQETKAETKHDGEADAKKPAKPVEKKLSGKRVAFAGTLVAVSLADATQRVETLGGTVVDAVDNLTTYLIVGNKGKAGEKLTTARKLQQSGSKVMILDEKGFADLVGVGQMALF
jgi:DNA ligase (NAD+)